MSGTPNNADPAVLPTSPMQDGLTPTPSDPVRSIVGGAGEVAPPATNADGVSENMDAVQQAAEPPAAAPEPLTWDQVELPEGMEVPEEIQAEFLGIFNNRDLTPAQIASQSVQLHARMMESVAAEMTQQWEETQASWREQIQRMPEMQGGRYEENLAEVARVVNRYGDREVRQAFDLTGAGNHPAIVRFLMNIAKDINEEQPVLGEPSVLAASSREDRLYGKQGG